MPCNRYGKHSKSNLRPWILIDHHDYAITNRKPHHTHRYNLYAQWDGMIFSKVFDVWTQPRMIHQP